jgi:hypothetical protein
MSYPTFVPLSIECYRNPSTVFFGNHLISSSVGAQQGDPCGPNIISLAIQPIILSLDSQLNIWYLDDGTLADYPEVVLSDCIVLKNSKNEKFPIHFCLVYIYIPGDQKGLFKLAVQLRKFYISVIYNTATGYVLLVYLTNI